MSATALTRSQKAAAILVAMGKPAASKLLRFFKQEELKALIESARLLRTIPQSDLERIVAEFEAEFTEGAGLLDSADKMDTILNDTLTPEEVSALMGETKAPAPANLPPPVWAEIETLDPVRLGSFLAGEHAQTAALILSKLSSTASAAVLLTLEGRHRAEIVKRMLSMSAIPEAALGIVESQLRSRVLAEGASKDTSFGETRVANLLNELDKGQLDQMLRELESSGADLGSVRNRLFSFEDVTSLDQKSRVALFDGLGSDVVTFALRGAEPELVEAVLSAIGARSRRMIESELAQGADGVNPAEVQKARRTVVSAALRLATAGTLQLPGAAPDKAAA